MIDELSHDLGAGGPQGRPSALRAPGVAPHRSIYAKNAHRPPGRLGGRFILCEETGIGYASRRAQERGTSERQRRISCTQRLLPKWVTGGLIGATRPPSRLVRCDETGIVRRRACRSVSVSLPPIMRGPTTDRVAAPDSWPPGLSPKWVARSWRGLSGQQQSTIRARRFTTLPRALGSRKCAHAFISARLLSSAWPCR
jgi:hypothetical protein